MNQISNKKIRFQNISYFFFQQFLIFFSNAVFSAITCKKKTMDESQILNPFGFGQATKVIDENRKPAEWYWDYLEFNEVVAENEFYVLFSDGLLVKKGRSKFRTSQYLKGERFTSFQKVYEKA